MKSHGEVLPGHLADFLSEKQDNWPEAQFRSVLQRSPEMWQARVYLGDCLVATGRFDEAIGLARLACEQTSYGQTAFVGTLGAAYAEAGQFERAVTASERACKVAASLGRTKLLARNQQMLEQFKKREPYRERN